MIGIVGGGISGLMVAHELGRRSIAHVLFEAGELPGGVIRSVVREGLPLELGPQRLRLTEPIVMLVEELGLMGQLLRADDDLPLWIYRKGRLRRVPFSPAEALRTDLVGWRGKARILLEPLTRGLRPEETVAEFFSRKFGREAYEAMLGPLYGGLYASDPARMRARHGLRITLEHMGVKGSLLGALLRRGVAARRSAPAATFRDGMAVLPQALAAEDATNVRTSVVVRALVRTTAGWSLRVDGSGEGPIDVEQVVLCCPSSTAARLLEPNSAGAARKIGGLRVNRLAVVHLSSTFDGRGLGYQVAFGEPLETRGVTWNSSIFDREGLFTAYLGGMRSPGLVDWPDSRIAETARREFQEVTGSSAEVLHVARTSMPAWDESWDLLDGLELPRGVWVCSNWNARPGLPGRIADAKAVVARLVEGGGR